MKLISENQMWYSSVSASLLAVNFFLLFITEKVDHSSSSWWILAACNQHSSMRC